MPAGRRQIADPGSLYSFAHLFYWDLKRLVEGGQRWRFDEARHAQLKAEIEEADLDLSPEQKRSVEEVMQQEIREGRLKVTDIAKRRTDLEQGLLEATREFLLQDAAEQARRTLKIPGEPEVFDALLKAETPEQVREICEDAFVMRSIEVAPGQYREVEVRNWPISGGSTLPMYLAQYASEFLAARADRRFPRSSRSSSRLKQIWFLSRALAGALHGIKTRTAINLVGSKRPEQVFYESRLAKPTRRHKKARKRRS
jgi:hypothetical protein